eukprot:jgi/Tetstr1/430291/TSEL_020116.t1
MDDVVESRVEEDAVVEEELHAASDDAGTQATADVTPLVMRRRPPRVPSTAASHARRQLTLPDCGGKALDEQLTLQHELVEEWQETANDTARFQHMMRRIDDLDGWPPCREGK